MNFTEYSQVWDLHIHTNRCPKGSNEFFKEFGEDPIAYVNNLMDKLIVDGVPRVSMISFTDHNQISVDVYNEFYKRDSPIKLIPGVEVDCIIDETKAHKHIVIYFDCEKDDLTSLAEKVNQILSETRDHGVSIELPKLFEKLLKINCNFIVSPHAFKQAKRSINYGWNEEETAGVDALMYMDQFFVFWEASGHSTIQKAKEFLESFGLRNRISIISFSDSDNFEKLESYLSCPHQYFHSLPTFRGLAMVGTDATRIRNKITPFDSNRNPGMIKEVIFDGITINFSTQLNAIIGGRGSGKSILLDSIALKIKDFDLLPKRKAFLRKFPITIRNYNDIEITSAFSIDYFNQAYVADLFSNDNFGDNLKKKFEDSFSSLTNIKKNDIENNNKSRFNGFLNEHVAQSVENLDAFSRDYSFITNDGLNLMVSPKGKVKIDRTNQIIDYDKELKRIDSYFEGLPQQISKNENLRFIENLLKAAIFKEIHKYNIKTLVESYSINTIIENYLNAKKSKSEASKKKASIEENIKTKIENLSYEAIFRNSIINAYFKIAQDFQIYYSEYSVEDGSEKNKFIFSNELRVTSPLDHLILIFNEFLNSRNYEVTSSNLVNTCKLFINGDLIKYLKDKVTLDNLKAALIKFEIEYTHVSNIYFVDDGKILDIMEQSPGTQTNILMEYIVYKRTSRPLLIDQPEDNIDNKTIYDKLRKWFTKLKTERQVIVVTHDANIVINSDAENVIIAEQTSDEKFVYHNGALEFDNIINDASSILDGGKEAVKRRLVKYES